MTALEQLKNRKIIRWAVAYLAASWVLLQIAQLLWGLYDWPPLILRLIPIFLAIGLLIVLVVAWFHGEKGEQRVTALELAMLTGILVIAGGVIYYARAKSEKGDVGKVSSSAPDQRSIAVLPFADRSPGKDQAYFSDGLTEELLNVLAQIPQIRVAARTSSFRFRDGTASLDSIAKALHVQYILEGSVRTAGDRVRISAQLSEAKSGYEMWSSSYDRAVKDVFAVQDEISHAIVSALRLKIAGLDSLNLDGTSDPEAHALVLKGLFALSNHRSLAGATEAKSLFEQAIARDSSYTRAWTSLASAHLTMAYRHYGPPDENYERAREVAQHALEIDAGSAEAHSVLGRVADLHDWRFAEAEAHFARAIELNPGLAIAHSRRAPLLMRLGRTDEAIAEAKRAVLLDPMSAATHNTLAAMYGYSGKLEEAVAELKVASTLVPTGGPTLDNLATAAAQMGHDAEAMQYMQRSLQIAPDEPFALGILGYVHAVAGRRAEAEKVLIKLKAVKDTRHYLIAMIYANLGDRDRAFAEMDRAVDAHEDLAPDAGIDPALNNLHGDKRWTPLLKRIGLPIRT